MTCGTTPTRPSGRPLRRSSTSCCCRPTRSASASPATSPTTSSSTATARPSRVPTSTTTAHRPGTTTTRRSTSSTSPPTTTRRCGTSASTTTRCRRRLPTGCGRQNLGIDFTVLARVRPRRRGPVADQADGPNATTPETVQPPRLLRDDQPLGRWRAACRRQRGRLTALERQASGESTAPAGRCIEVHESSRLSASVRAPRCRSGCVPQHRARPAAGTS